MRSVEDGLMVVLVLCVLIAAVKVLPLLVVGFTTVTNALP